MKYTHSVLYSISIKNIFYDNMDLKDFIFVWRDSKIGVLWRKGIVVTLDEKVLFDLQLTCAWFAIINDNWGFMDVFPIK